MAPRAPGVHTHEEWKGMAQPVGLVVEPVVLNRLGVFPESATTVLADWQQRLEQLLEDQPVGEQWLSVAPSFELFCQEVLAWQPGDLRKPEELAAPVAVHLDDYDEVLRPDWVVPEPSQGDGPLKAQLLVQELPLGTPFDALPKGADGRRSWEATPQQRLERLLKESEHPIGLLWNGVALRLVYAPRGESSGHLTFPLEPMTTVDGRPMLAAVQMLLGPDRLFEGGASNTRLRPLMEQSRKEQNEVSTRLAEQVLEALWILLRGFDAAGLEVEDPSHIYGGLITVLLRLVFLLYAEDEELMPTDSLYGQHYSVGGLAQRLRQDRTDYQNAMEGRRGAWATLLSLFRLVYDGGGSTEAYLPARHGDLFDPETYPFLEGRTTDTSYTDGPLISVPAISDDVVEQVLTKLLLLDGQILSYRALDVEQIGSVYEGIMGFMVEKATGPSVGITHRPPRQKITITVVVDANALLAQTSSKREAWLKDATGVDLKLPSKASKALKEAKGIEDLCDALDKRLSKHTPLGGFQAGALILQPTAERRRSGSHYTPRVLTEPIVAEAFRPWLERCHNHPTAQQILALKVCDPAMGSGAFLVAVCRFLAGWLVEAWERDGYPDDFRTEWDKDMVARRLVAQRCLYGVDKNPFAVNLAKLSLWLVTLSKELPFTFVDHAFKCGDSLLGYSVSEIQVAMHHVQLGFLDDQNRIYEQMGIDRRESFAFDSLTDADYDSKKQKLEQQIKATEGLRQAGDLMVAAFFAKSKPKERADKQQVYLAMLSGAFHDDSLAETVQEIRKRLADGDKGITPFHWDLEFPEVFRNGRDGFNVFVGNPPFLGVTGLGETAKPGYTDWLRARYSGGGGKSDLVAFFFRLAHSRLAADGAAALIATNSIGQGDTRRTGLKEILTSGSWIYYAKSRLRWPGLANVIVSLVCFSKNKPLLKPVLNGHPQARVSAYLTPGDYDRDPDIIPHCKEMAFLGVKVQGMGFVAGGKDKKCTDPQDLNDLLKAYPHYSRFVKGYIGGEHLGKMKNIAYPLQVMDLTDLSKDELDSLEPLRNFLHQRIWDDRKNKTGNLKSRWWEFGHTARDLVQRSSHLERMIVTPRNSDSFAFQFIKTNGLVNDKIVAFPHDSNSLFCVLQSRVHEVWARFLCSTLKDDLQYAPSDCVVNFPFPEEWEASEEMSRLGAQLDRMRAEYIEERCQGVTDFYNDFHSPSCKYDAMSALRDIQDQCDRAVGRSMKLGIELPSPSYEVDILEFDNALNVPQDLQIYLENDEISFSSAEEAMSFSDAFRALDATNKKIRWKYRWSSYVRDSVFKRLLEVNAEMSAATTAVPHSLNTQGCDRSLKEDVQGSLFGQPAQS